MSQHERVANGIGKGRLRATFQLVVEKAQVEGSVVDHQSRVAEELQELVGNIGKARHSLDEVVVDAVDFARAFGNVAFRVEVAMELVSCRHAMLQFDAADLDDLVPLQRVQPCCFRIDDDLAHHCLLRFVIGQSPC